MEIKRPKHESFNMTYEELFAFWLVIIREYPFHQIRSDSILLAKNSPLVSDKE